MAAVQLRSRARYVPGWKNVVCRCGENGKSDLTLLLSARSRRRVTKLERLERALERVGFCSDGRAVGGGRESERWLQSASSLLAINQSLAPHRTGLVAPAGHHSGHRDTAKACPDVANEQWTDLQSAWRSGRAGWNAECLGREQAQQHKVTTETLRESGRAMEGGRRPTRTEPPRRTPLYSKPTYFVQTAGSDCTTTAPPRRTYERVYSVLGTKLETRWWSTILRERSDDPFAMRT